MYLYICTCRFVVDSVYAVKYAACARTQKQRSQNKFLPPINYSKHFVHSVKMAVAIYLYVEFDLRVIRPTLVNY